MGFINIGDQLKVNYDSRNYSDSHIMTVEQIRVYLSDDEQIINVYINGVDELNKNTDINVKCQLQDGIGVSVHHLHSEWYYKANAGSIIEKYGRRGIVISKNESKGSTTVLWCDEHGVPFGNPIEYPDFKNFEVIGDVNVKTLAVIPTD